MSLKLPRERRDEARQQLARDLNPRLEKKAARNAKTVVFAGVAEEWIQMMSGPAREEKAFSVDDGDLEENCKAALDPATIKKHRWILDTDLNPAPGAWQWRKSPRSSCCRTRGYASTGIDDRGSARSQG